MIIHQSGAVVQSVSHRKRSSKRQPKPSQKSTTKPKRQRKQTRKSKLKPTTQSGIYRIFCTVTQQSYIGKSHNVISRLRAHLTQLRRGCHPNAALQQSFDLHGESSFVAEIITLVVDTPTARQIESDRQLTKARRIKSSFDRLERKLLRIEKRWIKTYASLGDSAVFNIACVSIPNRPTTGIKYQRAAAKNEVKKSVAQPRRNDTLWPLSVVLWHRDRAQDGSQTSSKAPM